MGSLQRAWFLFLVLGVITSVFASLVGLAPASLTSAVAMPHNLLQRAGTNLRMALISLADRSDLRQVLSDSEEHVRELEALNRDLQLRVDQLTEVLQVQADQSPGVVLTAPVTGISTSVLISRLTLGKGTRDGVLQNMVATVPQGLVGMVTETATGSSVVRVVTDPQSRVGVTVSGRGGQGVAVGLPGGTIRVIDFIESEPVRVGDRVETSSLGGLYPRGVLVGTVVEVPPADPNEIRSTFLVQPAVELSTLLEVALIAPR